jgi:predicted DNA binding CopG/RHH family protein
MSPQNADKIKTMTRASAGNDKINIYFNAQVLAALKRLALARGTTYSELIREACWEYVLRQVPKVLGEVKAVKAVKDMAR